MPERLTHSSNDLSFEAILVREPASKIAHTASSITSNIRNLSDVVEHVSTCEEKDGNQADSCPEVSILDNGQEIRASNT